MKQLALKTDVNNLPLNFENPELASGKNLSKLEYLLFFVKVPINIESRLTS